MWLAEKLKMIKISIEKIKNQFDELIEILEDSRAQKNYLYVSVKYGALCVSVHTCEEQLIHESQSSKKKLIKNQKTINILRKVENKMIAKANGPFEEIKESVCLGFEALGQINFSS